ncbi:hypothetical protein ACIRBZ_08380 [Streptomyces sp. NPDC094038]|uniref:hypothetical protein n=1 Tax=Streptomyces sp. NPDC094038 TaxID=3366055 RepID=UPI0038198905
MRAGLGGRTRSRVADLGDKAGALTARLREGAAGAGRQARGRVVRARWMGRTGRLVSEKAGEAQYGVGGGGARPAGRGIRGGAVPGAVAAAVLTAVAVGGLRRSRRR